MKSLKLHLILLILLTLLFVSMKGPAEAGQLMGKLSDSEGHPMKGVIVFFFNADTGPPPSPDIYWKAPDETTGTDGEGGFAVELREGNYYFGARDDVTWTHSGPPKGEDIYFLGTGPGDGLKTLSVRASGNIDVGIISVNDLIKILFVADDNMPSIQGTVFNQNGEPASGVVVEAYSSPDGKDELPYVSEYTDAEGQYIINLYEGGKYYLRTRYKDKGKSPEDAAPVEVNVRNGDKLSDIVLKVK